LYYFSFILAVNNLKCEVGIEKCGVDKLEDVLFLRINGNNAVYKLER